MKNKNKNPVIVEAVEILPDEKSLMQQLYSLLTVETTRLQARQKNSKTDLGIGGAKQLNQLIKCAKDINDENRTFQKQDAVEQLSDDERLEIMSQVILELPKEQRQKLFERLLSEENGTAELPDKTSHRE